MKPPSFQYIVASCAEEAVALLTQYGSDARLLAGGQSLMPLLNRRLVRPAVVIDVAGARDLRDVVVGDIVEIGATATQVAVQRHPDLDRVTPMLGQALAWVGSVATRNRGTLGGSAAFADPAAEVPAALVALNARFIARSRFGEREIEAEDFYTGVNKTVLRPDELLTKIRLTPDAPGTRTRYLEVARRPGGSRAIVGVAVSYCLDDEGRCSSARVAIAGVADTPVRARAVEALLAGAAIDAELLRAAGQAAVAELDPPSDALASSASRREIAAALVQNAFMGALTNG